MSYQEVITASGKKYVLNEEFLKDIAKPIPGIKPNSKRSNVRKFNRKDGILTGPGSRVSGNYKIIGLTYEGQEELIDETDVEQEAVDMAQNEAQASHDIFSKVTVVKEYQGTEEVITEIKNNSGRSRRSNMRRLNRRRLNRLKTRRFNAARDWVPEGDQDAYYLVAYDHNQNPVFEKSYDVWQHQEALDFITAHTGDGDSPYSLIELHDLEDNRLAVSMEYDPSQESWFRTDGKRKNSRSSRSNMRRLNRRRLNRRRFNGFSIRFKNASGDEFHDKSFDNWRDAVDVARDLPEGDGGFEIVDIESDGSAGEVVYEEDAINNRRSNSRLNRRRFNTQSRLNRLKRLRLNKRRWNQDPEDEDIEENLPALNRKNRRKNMEKEREYEEDEGHEKEKESLKSKLNRFKKNRRKNEEKEKTEEEANEWFLKEKENKKNRLKKNMGKHHDEEEEENEPPKKDNEPKEGPEAAAEAQAEKEAKEDRRNRARKNRLNRLAPRANKAEDISSHVDIITRAARVLKCDAEKLVDHDIKEIKELVVQEAFPNIDIEGRSDEYITATFDVACQKPAKKKGALAAALGRNDDYFSAAKKTAKTINIDEMEQEHIAKRKDAWKNNKQGGYFDPKGHNGLNQYSKFKETNY